MLCSSLILVTETLIPLELCIIWRYDQSNLSFSNHEFIDSFGLGGWRDGEFLVSGLAQFKGFKLELLCLRLCSLRFGTTFILHYMNPTWATLLRNPMQSVPFQSLFGSIASKASLMPQFSFLLIMYIFQLSQRMLNCRFKFSKLSWCVLQAELRTTSIWVNCTSSMT